MAGILSPKDAFNIVKAWKEEIGLPVQVHSHYTSGMASATYLKAIEAGADVVDCAISSMSLATSQPPVESIVAALDGTAYDTGLNLDLLSEIADYFKEVRQKYGAFDKPPRCRMPTCSVTNPRGMISNFISQLREQTLSTSFRQCSPRFPGSRKTWGIRRLSLRPAK
jgi:oxaloacetate decarboxylase alpha subunit